MCWQGPAVCWRAEAGEGGTVHRIGAVHPGAIDLERVVPTGYNFTIENKEAY